MPNANKPTGLSPVDHYFGMPWNHRLRMYCIPQANGSAWRVGDPYTIAGGADAKGIPTIQLASAGSDNPVMGCVASGAGSPVFGGSPGVPQEAPVLIPATKTRDYYVLCYDDPYIIYEVQEDSVGGALTAAEVGENINLIAGTTSEFFSDWMLDSSSHGTGATLQCHLLRAVQRIDNALGDYCKWQVLINRHPRKAGVAGI